MKKFPKVTRVRQMQKFWKVYKKLKLDLGYWDESVKFMGPYFSAVISKNITSAVHPTEDRFFNVRELLHLMGMPHE